MSATFADVLEIMYPGAQWAVLDGDPPVITYWSPENADPEPAVADVLAYWSANSAAIDLAIWRNTEWVESRRFFLALNGIDNGQGGTLLDDCEALVAQQSRAVQITWANATRFYRNDPLISQFAPAIGLTEDTQIDEVFRAAKAIA